MDPNFLELPTCHTVIDFGTCMYACVLKLNSFASFTQHGRNEGRTFKMEFEVDDVKVELLHGYKIGKVWAGIGVQP